MRACFCDDIKIAEKMRMISRHGQVKRYSHSQIGINGRLDTLQLYYYPNLKSLIMKLS